MEWKEIKRFYRDHEKWIRMAAMALVVVAALLFFGLNGKNQAEEGLLIENSSATDGALADQPSGEPESEAGVGTGFDLDGSRKQTTGELVVDISGQVVSPGVYRVIRGSRWADVIEMAGGLTAEADIDAINQAEEVVDGQKIYVPAREEGASRYGDAGSYGSGSSYGNAPRAQGSLININTADYETLQQIPGVGPSTASKIIEYRQANGNFAKIEDLMLVSGIGEKTFAKMKDKIRV